MTAGHHTSTAHPADSAPGAGGRNPGGRNPGGQEPRRPVSPGAPAHDAEQDAVAERVGRILAAHAGERARSPAPRAA